MNHKKQGAQESSQGLFGQALQLQQAGRLQDAECLYRQVLTIDPHHAHSLHMLGLMALQARRYDIAEDLTRKALAERNDMPTFHHTLGNILRTQEKIEDAVASYERALALKPDYTDCLNNLGTALLSLDRKDEALTFYKRAVAVNSKHFQALDNIGVILQAQKKYEEAVEYYRQALAVKPDAAGTHYNLGVTFMLSNKPEEAKARFEQAIEYKPDFADALSRLGHILRDEGKFDDALQYFLRVTSIRPDGHAHGNIAFFLKDKGRLHEALAEYERALTLIPGNTQILNNIGTIYNELGKYEDAITYYKKTLAIEPDRSETLDNLASTHKNLGQLDEAMAYYKQALTASPDNPAIYNNLLLAMVYMSSISPVEMAAAARYFGEHIADPLRRSSPFANNKDPERKLRIGYVSADFREHAVNYFFEPLLTSHDHTKFEIFVYSNTVREDATTARLKQHADHWRDIRFLSDDATADLIEADAIDILIDLAGHTSGNRLLVFARKPAPIQATWLGHPASTGMKAMDYRITDNYAEPPGMTEHLNTETLWRLPEFFCCYQAHENSPAVIDHPPSEDNGYITFGCFNNFTRVTDPTLEAWAKIMAQVPNSHLLLEIIGIDTPKFRDAVKERLQRLGLPLERVILEPRKRSNQFVLYNKIDIALDPFPCVGGTTSMDTLWMGVPLITLAGDSFLSRIGVTVLTNAGLPELIAKNVEDYVSLTVDLAKDHAQLKKLRHNLRDKVAASPLMNAKNFAYSMEDAYRKMWRKWCASEEKGTR